MVRITGYVGSSKTPIVPTEINRNTVYYIGGTDITELVLPQWLTRMGVGFIDDKLGTVVKSNSPYVAAHMEQYYTYVTYEPL